MFKVWQGVDKKHTQSRGHNGKKREHRAGAGFLRCWAQGISAAGSCGWGLLPLYPVPSFPVIFLLGYYFWCSYHRPQCFWMVLRAF